MRNHCEPQSAEQFSAAGFRFGIVRARFNAEITAALCSAAMQTLQKAGAASAQICVIDVPGAIELPLMSQQLIRTHQCDGVVALGCVIRGQTDHYQHVCRVAIDGLMRVMLDTGRPVTCGIITADTEAQAKARAGGEYGNVGETSTLTLVEMLHHLQTLQSLRT